MGKVAKALVVVDGRGRKPQLQRTSRRSWTREKEERFLAVLSETCNVTRAVEAVSMSVRGAYLRRTRNAAFRAAWLETISAAYQRLELVLLDRAFNGTEKVIRRHDGSEDRMVEYPNQLGLSLLKMHRTAVGEPEAELPPDDLDEVRERVLGKLKRLKERREREAADGE